MKDYTELEQVKECRDEYKKSLYGELDLFFKEVSSLSTKKK